MKKLNKNNYKIAILDDMLPPYRIPLYNYLNNSEPSINIEVILSSLKQGDRSWDIKDEEINFPIKMIKGYYMSIRTKHSRMGVYHMHFNPGIIRLLMKKKYDAVIISGYSSLTHQIAIILCRVLKIPVILWYRSFSESQSTIRKIVNLYLYKLIKTASSYIVPGAKSESYLINMGVLKGSIYRIANPVDNNYYLSQFIKLSNKENVDNSKSIKILFVGRLMESKGVWELLYALEKLNSVYEDGKIELRIVGDGILSNQLKSWVANQNIQNIYFIGHLEKEDLCKEYYNADIFVLPSHYEPWGLVVNEAMIFHLPIIATNTIGAADEIIFNNKNGFLIEPKNTDMLFSAIRDLVDNKSIRKAMGNESAKMIKNINHKRSGDVILSTLNKILVN